MFDYTLKHTPKTQLALTKKFTHFVTNPHPNKALNDDSTEMDMVNGAILKVHIGVVFFVSQNTPLTILATALTMEDNAPNC